MPFTRIPFYILAVSIASLQGCSPEQNTATADAYHNVTARYNSYFYAREKALEVEKIILKSLDDDPNHILQLFPKLDTAKAKGYAKDTEEIIKMASISIQRHPNSRWVDDSYVLVGLARLYACDFPNAIQTLKYVNGKSKKPDVRHRALIYLMRTFTEQQEYEKTEEVYSFLEKEKLNKINQKNLYLEKAYLFQIRLNYNHMVQNLTAADSLLTREDRKGRIYFIIGQVYQMLGFESEAYNYYRKCLSTNPDYEIDFYARLNLAQVARLDDRSDVKLIRKQFEKMLADDKNKEFKDKIYFEIGDFEKKQGNLTEAMTNYKLAAHSGNNKRISGTAFLRLGELCYDSLKKYSLAKAYYDSAVSFLTSDFEGFDGIKKRQQMLGEFVQYTEAISWNDSLLMLSSLDTATLRRTVDSVIQARKSPEVGKKKKRRFLSGDDPATPSGTLYQTDKTTTSDWYFGNPSAIALGQTEFQRIWGNVALEDNWRRSGKTAVLRVDEPLLSSENSTYTGPDNSSVNKSGDEFGELLAKIPKTDDEKKNALATIEDAYFKLGDLYYFQLEEKDNASRTYEKLLERFPTSSFKAEVLYKLYLIARENNNGKAGGFSQTLQDEFPNSTYTRIMLNPDYLKETTVAAEKQKILYREAYADFQAGQLIASIRKADQAITIGETKFSPQLELLKILVTGKTEDITRYQFELGEFLKKYPDGNLNPYANRLLEASKQFQEKTERAKGIRFTRTFEQAHYLVIAHHRDDKLSTPLSDALENYNSQQFRGLKLNTSNLALTEEMTLTFVIELADKATSLGYLNKVRAQLLNSPSFKNFKFNIFVITKDNFNTFYRTRALDEYLAFFDRNYQKENP